MENVCVPLLAEIQSHTVHLYIDFPDQNKF